MQIIFQMMNKLSSLVLTYSLVFFVILGNISTDTVTTAQTEVVSSDEELYFWRQNLEGFTIVDAKIFPLISLGTSLENLGAAWIAWTINTSDGLIGLRALYVQGEIIRFGASSQAYDSISWFNLQDTLIFIGVANNRTRATFYLSNGNQLNKEIIGTTQDHQLFLSDNGFFMYLNNTGIGRQELYTLINDVTLLSIPTEERFVSAGIRGAVIQKDTDRVFYNGITQNITVPSDLSYNLRVGHFQLIPIVFDIDNQELWIPGTGIRLDFPENEIVIDTNYYGFQSSVIITENNAYELDSKGEWDIVGSYNNTPFDFGVVDIGLYIGPITYHGLGLVTSGFDLDNDKIPDTMEDYFGSLSTTSDSDGDGIGDKLEIATGLDPSVKDANFDYDRDYLLNSEELALGLDPLNGDSDYGGALDGWEINYGYDPYSGNDDLLDEDSDGITNAEESVWNSDPRNADTDGDGLPDRWEINFGISPTTANADRDPDQDGRTNFEEYRDGTDPLVKDPKMLFEGAYNELIVIVLFSLPIAILMWIKYPKIKSNTQNIVLESGSVFDIVDEI